MTKHEKTVIFFFQRMEVRLIMGVVESDGTIWRVGMGEYNRV